ncbi:MAG: sel1 repeat family protein [Magnetococcales bacterium]|nr:sel1 repeat family protein [Magnetococcales bacterium]
MMVFSVDRLSFPHVTWRRFQWFVAVALVLVLVTAIVGVPHHSNSASVQLIRHMAQDGNPDAQLQLGLAYRAGRYHLAKNDRLALYWLQRAAEEIPFAAILVGDAYARGVAGIAADPGLAQEWWKRAALAGDARGWKRLGQQPPVSRIRVVWNSFAQAFITVFLKKHSWQI